MHRAVHSWSHLPTSFMGVSVTKITCIAEVRFLATTHSFWDFKKAGQKGGSYKQQMILRFWVGRRKNHNSSGRSPNDRESSAHCESDHRDRVENRVTSMKARKGM